MKLSLVILLYISIQLELCGQAANITSHNYKDSSSSKRYNITVNYPQVDFGPDALMGIRGIAQDINHSIDTLRENLVNDFMNEVKGLPPAPCTDQPSYLEVSYKTEYNNSSLFSFRFETFSAPDCANHPYTYITALNYSAASVGAFKLADVFIKDKPWLKFISGYTRNELIARAKKDKLDNSGGNIEEGTAPVEDNFRVFTVNGKGLTIIFNPYRVGPWIWGIQSVEIPYSEMKDMIDPGGPLSSVIK